MTLVVDGILIIEEEVERNCELCGVMAECRPYGPNNEQICYECGMKNIETTHQKFMERMEGVNTIAGSSDILNADAIAFTQVMSQVLQCAVQPELTTE